MCNHCLCLLRGLKLGSKDLAELSPEKRADLKHQSLLKRMAKKNAIISKIKKRKCAAWAKKKVITSKIKKQKGAARAKKNVINSKIKEQKCAARAQKKVINSNIKKQKGASDGQAVAKAHDGDGQDWAKRLSVFMSSTVHDALNSIGDDAAHSIVDLGVPKLSNRPMGWAVFNGSKMRDVVHLSCHSCLNKAENKRHAANIKVFLQMQRASLFAVSGGQELVVKDV